MKARVKATEEIIEVFKSGLTLTGKVIYGSERGAYSLSELDFINDVKEKSFPKDDPDYWTRLEHQYAGMAMQGMIIHYGALDECGDLSILASSCVNLAHALVEKLKEEK